MRRRRMALGCAAISLILVGMAAPAASGSLIKVREVFPGTAASPDSGYIELQMTAAGQNAVMGDKVQVWDSAGFNVYDAGLPNSVANAADQATILLGDTATTVTPDFTDASLNLYVQAASGGAVCLPDATPPDCVAWGPPMAMWLGPLPGSVGAHAAPAGIPDGSSLTRSIAANCPTLLEAADDTDDSGADFGLTTPSPRNNSATPTETPCITAQTPPQTPATPTTTASPKGCPKGQKLKQGKCVKKKRKKRTRR